MKYAIIFLLAQLIASFTAGDTLQKFIKETQQLKSEGSGMTIVWWIPSEYWEASFRQDKTLSEDGIKMFLETVDQYDLALVIDVEFGMMGSIKGKGPEYVNSHITLTYDGETYQPLPVKDINDDMINFLDMMKPLFVNMMGNLGNEIEFAVFQKDGAKIINPLSEGHFELNYDGDDFRFRLPLAALLPDKVDPKTGEVFPGNYEFNPYTGDALK